MKITNVTVFCKHLTCPASETLLAYSEKNLGTATRDRIDLHLETCDFCQAEVQLLTEHTPSFTENCECAEMPVHLRLLAESIMAGEKSKPIFLSVGSFDNEPVHLTDV
jgi:hypothetical protein